MIHRIAIVGAGGVGGAIGGYLTRAGARVTLIDPWPEHVEAMRARGLLLSGMGEAENFAVPVEALHIGDVQAIAKQDLIDIAIIAVKSYDTAWAAALIAPYLAPQGYIVSAQNSINENCIAEIVGWGRTVGCIVGGRFAVELVEPGHVRRNMVRDLKFISLHVGEIHGSVTPRLEALAKLLKNVDGAGTTSNLWGMRWSKLCVNGMRNSGSAATAMNGNDRDRHDLVRRVLIRLGGEAVAVGLALGYDLAPIAGIPPEMLLAASRGDLATLAKVENMILDGSTSAVRNDEQRPSMGQDMRKGRRTEIDAINGLISSKGREVGIPTPTHDAMTDIIKRVERGEIPARPENLFHLAKIPVAINFADVV
jgi:2-dehydropantoate 2-reductase